MFNSLAISENFDAVFMVSCMDVFNPLLFLFILNEIVVFIRIPSILVDR